MRTQKSESSPDAAAAARQIAAGTTTYRQGRFDAWRRTADLLEYATEFGNHYALRSGRWSGAVGVPLRPVRHRLAGKQQYREKAGSDVVSVFILPPSRPIW